MGRLTLNILLVVRPVRAGDDRRADPRQDRRVAPQGHVDGRHPAARLRRARPQAGGERDGGRAGPADLRSVPRASARQPSWRRSCAAPATRRNRGRRRTASTGRASRSTRARSTRSSNNRVYLGEAVHKGTSYPGEHEAIIDHATWDKVHAILAENTVARANSTRAQTPALLRGLIFAPGGHAMTPSHTRKERQALPLLRRHRRHSTGLLGMPGAQRAGSRGRGSGRRAGAASAAHARDHRADVGGGEERGDEDRRNATSSRPSPTSRRCGTSCSRPSRRGSSGCWSSGSISSPDGMQVRLRAEGLQTLVEELRSREARAA